MFSHASIIARLLSAAAKNSAWTFRTYYKAVRRTYYKAVRVGGGGEWRTCVMRDDEPRPVWMGLPITH